MTQLRHGWRTLVAETAQPIRSERASADRARASASAHSVAEFRKRGNRETSGSEETPNVGTSTPFLKAARLAFASAARRRLGLALAFPDARARFFPLRRSRARRRAAPRSRSAPSASRRRRGRVPSSRARSGRRSPPRPPRPRPPSPRAWRSSSARRARAARRPPLTCATWSTCTRSP